MELEKAKKTIHHAFDIGFGLLFQNEVIKPAIDGMMNVLKSCAKAGTVRRVVFTSSAGTTCVHARRKEEYDENSWSDVEFCRAKKMTGWVINRTHTRNHQFADYVLTTAVQIKL